MRILRIRQYVMWPTNYLILTARNWQKLKGDVLQKLTKYVPAMVGI